MYFEEEEDFDFVAGSSAPVGDDEELDNEVETSENEAEDEDVETTTSEKEENSEDDVPDEEEDEEEEKPSKPAKDSKTQALSAERARRKQAERELKELKAKLEEGENAKLEETNLQKEREAYKQKMLEGDLVDEEVADKLLEVFGDDIIKTKLANQKRAEEVSFEEQLSELKKEDLFMDADVYKPQIKEFMKKGLTAKQAYMASVSDARFSQMKKDLEVEAEQRFLNRSTKANRVAIGAAEAKSEMKKGTYSKREQEIARETGLPVSEVHKRSKMTSIDDFEKL